VAQEDAYAEQLSHFCAVVRGEAEPIVSGEDAARSLAATVAILEAAATGRAVQVGVEVGA